MARTRTRTKTKLIIFLCDGNEDQYFGFKIVSVNEAKQFLYAVKQLENNNSRFNVGSDSFEYSTSYFTIVSVGSSEEKTLVSLFDIDIEDESTENGIGIIPNAIEDAYDEGLIDDEEQDLDDIDEDYY